MEKKKIMVKKTIDRLRQHRDYRKHTTVINGISIPQDSTTWSDDLERAVFRSRLGF